MRDFEVSEPLRVLTVETSDGAVLRVRQHGNPQGPRVLLSHGNGFATNAYYPFWHLLEPDFELLVYDQRNHGENPFAGSFGHHVEGFRADLARLLEAIARALGPKPLHGAFHSISAVASLAHAVAHGWPWERLVLFDPPLVPSPGEPLHEEAFRSERFLAGWALQRDDAFDDPGELARHLRSVRGMQRWVPGAHELMARSLLREHEGRWRLSCPRELEAVVYLSNAFAPVWRHLGRLAPHRDRLLVLTADPDLEGARYPPLVARRLHERFGFAVMPVTGTSHMLQLEEPARCAQLLVEYLA